MNVVLVGMMGSGKSSAGRILATRLGWPFVDTDAEIEAEAGLTIPALFARDGEAGFRARERAVVARVSGGDLQVVATGGGAVLAPENRAALREGGLVFWLKAPPAELYRRALEQGIDGRPLLAGEDPLGRLAALSASREEAYRAAAHHVVETDEIGPEAVADRILALLKEVLDHGKGPG